MGLNGWVRLVSLPGRGAPYRVACWAPALVAPASLVVDVLDDLRLGGGPHLGAEVAGDRRPFDVVGRRRGAQRAGGGQAGLDARVGRVAVDVSRVRDLLDPRSPPETGLPGEDAPSDPAVAAPRDRDAEKADDDQHPAGRVQVEDR